MLLVLGWPWIVNERFIPTEMTDYPLVTSSGLTTCCTWRLWRRTWPSCWTGWASPSTGTCSPTPTPSGAAPPPTWPGIYYIFKLVFILIFSMTRQLLQQLRQDELQALVDKYKLDFRLYGYDTYRWESVTYDQIEQEGRSENDDDGWCHQGTSLVHNLHCSQ